MNYPYKAWQLMPSMIAREVEIVGKPFGFGDYLETDKGQYPRKCDVFKTKEEAIAGGYAKLEKQKASLEKQKALLAKREANLLKQASK